MSLRAKLFLPLLFFSALLFAYLYGYWIPQSISQTEDEYHESTERHIDSVIEGIVPLLLSGQLDTLHENLNTLMRKNKYWLGLQITDPSGKMIYPLQSLSAPEIRTRRDVHTFEIQIRYLDTKLGKLVLKEDCGPRLDAIRKRHRKLTAALLISMTVFFLSIGIVLERFVSSSER